MKDEVFIAETRAGKSALIYIFVPVSDNFEDVCRRLLITTFNQAIYNKRGKFDFVYIGSVEVENRLRKLDFEVRQGVVPYKYL